MNKINYAKYSTRSILGSNTDTRKSFDASSIPSEDNLPGILFITSFPPRECGIATYSQDLIRALENKFKGSFKISICPLESENEVHQYDLEIKYPNKIEFEVDYIVYTYDNFKFYLKKIDIQDHIGLWFHLQNTVKESLEWKENTK